MYYDVLYECEGTTNTVDETFFTHGKDIMFVEPTFQM